MEFRLLPSAIGVFDSLGEGFGNQRFAGGAVPGEPYDPDDDDEDVEADEPVSVAGAFLTSTQYGDARSDSYTDVFQGGLDTCVFASTLAAVARTNAPLATRITTVSRSSGSVTYTVNLYRPSSPGSTSWVPTTQTVVYTGRHSTDLKLGDDGETWPIIMQRAYLQMCESEGLNYRLIENAYGALLGNSGTSVAPNSQLSQALAMRASLQRGAPIVVGSIDSGERYPSPNYGIVIHHAYTVMGIEIPANRDLSRTYVTLRNPWGIDAETIVFDSNHDGSISGTEYDKWTLGLDGANDGIVRVPWATFSRDFDNIVTASYSGPNLNTPANANQNLKFTTPPAHYTIYEGQQLKLTLKAVDSVGKPVIYTLLSNRGFINPQSGVYTWQPRRGDADFGGSTHIIQVLAETSTERTTTALTVTVLSFRPEIASLQATPTSIKDDGADKLTLTAKSVTTNGSHFSQVEFWRDANNNGLFDRNNDVLLGYGTKGTGNDWSWSGYVSGLKAGQQGFFTRAVSYSSTDTFWSFDRFTAITVTKAPKSDPVAIPRTNQGAVSSPFTGEELIDRVVDAAGNAYLVTQLKLLTVPTPNPIYQYLTLVSKFDAQGSLLGRQVIAGPMPSANTLTAKVLPNSDGTSAVLYTVGSTGYPPVTSLYAITFTSQFTVVKSATLLSNAQISDGYFDAASDRSGNLLIAFHSGTYLNEDVYGLAVSRNLVVTRSLWNLTTGYSGIGSQKYPTVAMNSRGDSVIAWFDTHQGKLIARLQAGDGSITYGDFTVANYAQADTLIESAIDDRGIVSIAWPEEAGLANINQTTRVMLQRFWVSGYVPGPAIQVNTFVGGLSSGIRIASCASGWMAVGWNNSVKDGTAQYDSGVYAQVFNADGEKAGPEFPLHNVLNGDQYLRGLVMDDDGDISAMWQHYSLGIALTFSRTFDVDVPPAFQSSTLPAIPENSVAGTVLGTVKATDPDPGSVVTYALQGPSPFVIHPLTGKITVAADAPLDYEAFPFSWIAVTATSNSKVTTHYWKVDVADVNEAPLLASNGSALTYTEDGDPVLFGADLVVTDVDSPVFDGGILTASIVTGGEATDVLNLSTASGVSIDSSKTVSVNSIPVGKLLSTGSAVTPLQIQFNSNATQAIVQTVIRSLQFATGWDPASPARTLSIVLSDGAGATSNTLQETIAVVNVVNPTIRPFINSVAENVTIGSVVATLSVSDSTLVSPVYSLISGEGATDNSAFVISGNQLKTKTSLDFEKKSAYSIRVQMKDSTGLLIKQVLTIQVTNVNEKPTAVAVSSTKIAELNAVGAVIGSFTTTDPDTASKFTYSLVGTSADRSAFTISGNELKAAVKFDFETKKTYSITVRSIDDGGLFIDSVFTITVANVNEAPIDIKLSNSAVKEGSKVGTTIGILSTIDLDGSAPKYSLVAGPGDNDNALFTLSGTTLKTKAVFDFEAKSTYSIRVRVTDAGGLTFDKILEIKVIDVSDK